MNEATRFYSLFVLFRKRKEEDNMKSSLLSIKILWKKVLGKITNRIDDAKITKRMVSWGVEDARTMYEKVCKGGSKKVESKGKKKKAKA